MGAPPRPPCWSGRNEPRRCNLALRQMPDGIFSAAAPLRALSRRYVRRGSGLPGRGGEGLTIRHMLGENDWQPRRIASVRTSDGQRLPVALTRESAPGTLSELFGAKAGR